MSIRLNFSAFPWKDAELLYGQVHLLKHFAAKLSLACFRWLPWLLVVGAGQSICADIIQVRAGDDLIGIVNSARRGDEVRVAPGSYRGGDIIRSGVTIQAADNAGTARFTSPVVVTASDVTLIGMTWEDVDGILLQLQGDRIQIRGCEFRGFGRVTETPSKGIWIRETSICRDILVEDCVFEDWGRPTTSSSCIKVSQVGGAQHQRTVIRRNIFRRGAKRGNNCAIQVFAATRIERNVIYDVEDAIEVKGSGNVILHNHLHHNTGFEQLSNRVGDDNRFENNRVHDCQGPAGWCAEGQRIAFCNNLIYRNSQGIRLTGRVFRPDGSLRYRGVTDVLIANNVFYGNQRPLTSDDRQASPPVRAASVNNIFWGGRIELGPGVLAAADHNLYYQVDVPECIRGNHDRFDVAPDFADVSAGDFRLSADSPAIDRGTNASPVTGVKLSDTDAEGNRRGIDGDADQRDGVDIGAYELVPSPR